MSGSPEKVLVAMSGGVDSSVAAARLLEAGHEVVGAFMRNGVQAGEGRAHRQGCCSVDDAMDARRVADLLGVPFYAVNLSDAFDRLIDDFADAYVRGHTPNPCIECNRRFKMGALLSLARKLGATSVATGHYARIVERDGRHAIHRGRDADKDQSYVLFPLDQEALAHTRFPLGGFTKAQVRDEARRLGIRVADKPESMEICFVPTGDYRDVLRERVSERLAPGTIVDENGASIGEHAGTAFFTIGQRRGLPGGHSEPRYVTALDPGTGTVTVGPRAALESREVVVGDVVFSGIEPSASGSVLQGDVKIRHRHAAAPASVEILGEGRVRVVFDEAQFAITPGQAAVLYDDDRVLLGGWIAQADGYEV